MGLAAPPKINLGPSRILLEGAKLLSAGWNIVSAGLQLKFLSWIAWLAFWQAGACGCPFAGVLHCTAGGVEAFGKIGVSPLAGLPDSTSFGRVSFATLFCCRRAFWPSGGLVLEMLFGNEVAEAKCMPNGAWGRLSCCPIPFVGRCVMPLNSLSGLFSGLGTCWLAPCIIGNPSTVSFGVDKQAFQPQGSGTWQTVVDLRLKLCLV